MSANEETLLHTDNPRTSESSFALFALMAKQTHEAERVATAFQLQRQALLRDAADDETVRAAVWALEESEADMVRLTNRLKRQLRAYCRDARVLAFVTHTQGLGGASFLFLGLLPQWISDFKTVGRLWAYCGLHVVDGEAPRRKAGVKSNWSAFLKSVAIKRMAEPCVKNRRSPYRAVYDARRAHTAGRDWPDWRKHKDAMRVTAKSIVKDLWRVSRGQSPLFGGVDQRTREALTTAEHPPAAAA